MGQIEWVLTNENNTSMVTAPFISRNSELDGRVALDIGNVGVQS